MNARTSSSCRPTLEACALSDTVQTYKIYARGKWRGALCCLGPRANASSLGSYAAIVRCKVGLGDCKLPAKHWTSRTGSAHLAEHGRCYPPTTQRRLGAAAAKTAAPRRVGKRGLLRLAIHGRAPGMRPRARTVASLPEQRHSCISRAAPCLIVSGVLASVRPRQHTNCSALAWCTDKRGASARIPAGFVAAPVPPPRAF